MVVCINGSERRHFCHRYRRIGPVVCGSLLQTAGDRYVMRDPNITFMVTEFQVVVLQLRSLSVVLRPFSR